MKDKEKFLRRMYIYRLQYVFGGIVTFFSWVLLNSLFYCNYWTDLCSILGIWEVKDYLGMLLLYTPIVAVSVFNTVTYFYSQYLVKKYGADLFGDLDQDWLREFQGFDSSAFGEIFTRLIQCRKIAGPYLLATFFATTLIHQYLGIIIGLIYVIAYSFYRDTYFDTAIADKVPRSMGGGVVVSRIIDREFTDKIDQLSKDLKQAKKK